MKTTNFACILVIVHVAMFHHFARAVGDPSETENVEFIKTNRTECVPQSYARVLLAVETNFDATLRVITGIQLPETNSAAWQPMRKLKATLWFQLLSQMDRVRDLGFHEFNPRNWPMLNLVPPGFKYDSGVDPADIKEPDIREAYQAAIDANVAVQKRLDFERNMTKKVELLDGQAVEFAKSCYKGTAEDAKELGDLLELVADPEHKGKLKQELAGILGAKK
jgi:hypothetical protein